MPREVLGLEKPDRKILSSTANVRVPEKTEMLFLKMQRKDKRPQIRAPPRKSELCIRKKIAILVVKHCNRAREAKDLQH